MDKFTQLLSKKNRQRNKINKIQNIYASFFLGNMLYFFLNILKFYYFVVSYDNLYT